ncbi:MAG: translation initiation factor IF-6 [archaeon]
MTLILSFYSNPNIGLYGFCTDSYCLLGNDVPEEAARQIGKELNVPIHRLNIAGTSMLGVFLVGNNHTLLVPDIAFPDELKRLEQYNLPYQLIKTKFTCLGNNIIMTDKAALVNKELPKELVQQIRDSVNIPVQQAKIADVFSIGSMAAHNRKGMLVSHDITDDEYAFLADLFKLPITTGTVNFGNAYISSGVLVNRHGLVIGAMSGGPELVNAEQAFGFTEG